MNNKNEKRNTINRQIRNFPKIDCGKIDLLPLLESGVEDVLEDTLSIMAFSDSSLKRVNSSSIIFIVSISLECFEFSVFFRLSFKKETLFSQPKTIADSLNKKTLSFGFQTIDFFHLEFQVFF